MHIPRDLGYVLYNSSQAQFCATHGGSGVKEQVRAGRLWTRATFVRCCAPAAVTSRRACPQVGAHPHRPWPVPAQDRLQVRPHRWEEGSCVPEIAHAECVDATRSSAVAGGGPTAANVGGQRLPTQRCCWASTFPPKACNEGITIVNMNGPGTQSALFVKALLIL